MLQDDLTKYGRLKGFILKKHLMNIVKDLVSKYVAVTMQHVLLLLLLLVHVVLSLGSC